MKPSIKLITAAEKVLALKAQVESLRPMVTKIQEEIIKDFGFKTNTKYAERNGEDVTPKTTYLMSDEDFDLYHTALMAEYKKAGFINLPEGHCPLLVAENDLRKAEKEFMTLSIELNRKANWTPEMIEEVATASHGLETRKKFLDLNLSYVVPFIDVNACLRRANIRG